MKLTHTSKGVEGDMTDDIDKFEQNLREMRMECTENRLTMIEIKLKRAYQNTVWLAVGIIMLSLSLIFR